MGEGTAGLYASGSFPRTIEMMLLVRAGWSVQLSDPASTQTLFATPAPLKSMRVSIGMMLVGKCM